VPARACGAVLLVGRRVPWDRAQRPVEMLPAQ
jgi:hypothetical protein